MERDEAERLLWEIVSTLPEHLRWPVVLHYAEGESTLDIAERLGLTPEAVRKRLQLARERLRGDLQRRLGDVVAAVVPPSALASRIRAVADAAPISTRADGRTTPGGSATRSALLSGSTLVVTAALCLFTAFGIWTSLASDEPDADEATQLSLGESAAAQGIAPSVRGGRRASGRPSLGPTPVSTNRMAVSTNRMPNVDAPGRRPALAAPSEAGSISVLLIDLKTGRPIPAAAVELTALDPEPSVSRSSTTDQEGRLSWEHLEPGRYRVSRERERDEGRTVGAIHQVVVLEEGEEEVLTLRCKQHFTVSGVLRERGTGRLVPGVTLSVLTREEPPRLFRIQQPTDAQGRFRQRGFEGGPVVFLTPDPWSRLPTWVGGTKRLELGEATIEHGSKIELEYPWNGRVTGRALEASTGRPIEEVRVGVWSSHSSRPAAEQLQAGPSALTDDSGRFVLQGLPTDRTLVVGARKEGFPAAWSEPLRAIPGTEEPSPEVVMEIARWGTLSGRVLLTNGSPATTVTGAYVWSHDDGHPFSEPRRVGVEPDGGYRLGEVPPGEHWVWLSWTSESSELFSEAVSVRIHSGEVTSRDLLLAGDESEIGHLEITGRVHFEDPAHATRVVRAFAERLPHPAGRHQGFVDGQAQLLLRRLPPGRYRVWAQYDGLSEASAAVEVEAGARDITLWMPAPRDLAIRVVSSRPSQPIDGAELILLRSDTGELWRSAPTGADGRCTLSVGAGRFVVFAAAAGHAPRSREMIIAGQLTDVTLELTKGRRLWGRVIDVEGRPYRGEVVLVCGSENGPWKALLSSRVPTDPDGSFTIDHAPDQGGRLGILRAPTSDAVLEGTIAPAEPGVILVVPSP